MENKLNQNFGHWTQHRCAYFDTWNFHRGNFSTGVYNGIREGVTQWDLRKRHSKINNGTGEEGIFVFISGAELVFRPPFLSVHVVMY